MGWGWGDGGGWGIGDGGGLSACLSVCRGTHCFTIVGNERKPSDFIFYPPRLGNMNSKPRKCDNVIHKCIYAYAASYA